MTTRRRSALRLALVGLTVTLYAGIHAASMVAWLPRLEAAYVAASLSGTIASRGIEEAVKQYQRFKLAEAPDRHAPEPVLSARGSLYE